MYTLEVHNPCRCFLRSGMAEQESFSTQLEAREAAETMLERMKRDFCKKHDFILTQTGIRFTITIRPRG